MSVAGKFKVIADRVYEKGMSDKESQFWDELQWNGTRKVYSYAFARWNSEYIRPKYKVVIAGDYNHIFAYCNKVKKVEKEYFDFSGGADFACSALFNSCSELEEIEDVGLSLREYYQTFSYNGNLHTIEKLNVKETCGYQDAFHRCSSLKKIHFDGIIAKNISFVYCSLLTIESLDNIIEHLKDFTAAGNGSATITLHDDSKALLGEEGLKRITDKGWEVM